MSEMSKRIYEAISDSGLSYGDLNKITGISKSALQRYAIGETEKIPLDRIELIAKATNVSAEYLLGWDNKKPATNEGDGLSVDKAYVIDIIRNLDDRQAKLARNYLELLIGTDTS